MNSLGVGLFPNFDPHQGRAIESLTCAVNIDAWVRRGTKEHEEHEELGKKVEVVFGIKLSQVIQD